MSEADVALVFDVTFQITKDLGEFVDHGLEIVNEPGEREWKLLVRRMNLSRLAMNCKVNKRYYNLVIRHIMSIDALARLKVVRETLSRMVQDAMSRYLRAPFRCTERIAVVMSALLDGRELNRRFWSSHQVIWNDGWTSEDDQCLLELKHPWATFPTDADVQTFRYVSPEDGTIIRTDADQSTPKSLSDEDRRAVVRAHMHYFFSKLSEALVHDFFKARWEYEQAKLEWAYERREARFLQENREALNSLMTSDA
jgi:hypothetical protein